MNMANDREGKMAERSANEIAMLIARAVRGGGLPSGIAEELALAADYLELPAISACPFRGSAPDILAICAALDRGQAGERVSEIVGDHAVISAMIKAREVQMEQRLTTEESATGLVLSGGNASEYVPHAKLGRRKVPPALLAHLEDLAAQTLVPESEASRLSGAGAGLTDND